MSIEFTPGSPAHARIDPGLRDMQPALTGLTRPDSTSVTGPPIGVRLVSMVNWFPRTRGDRPSRLFLWCWKW